MTYFVEGVRRFLARRSIIASVLVGMAMIVLVASIKNFISGSYAPGGMNLGFSLILFSGSRHPDRFAKKAEVWWSDHCEEGGLSSVEVVGVFLVVLSAALAFL